MELIFNCECEILFSILDVGYEVFGNCEIDVHFISAIGLARIFSLNTVKHVQKLR